MVNIAVIGAGSIVFSTKLISDLVLNGAELRGARVTLMDINKDRLDIVHRLATIYAKKRNVAIEFRKTTSCKEALVGADFVINTAFVPGYTHMEAERTVAERHGYYRGIGDRVCDYYGGIGAYAQLRFVLNLAHEMEEVCPKAWLLQSANPVLESSTLIGRETSIRIVGMCHGYAKVKDLIQILGLNVNKVVFQVAGLNHCIWLTTFTYNGEDAYPLIDKWFLEKAQDFWASEEFLFNPWNDQLSPAAYTMYKLFGLFPIGDTVRAASPWWFHVDLEEKKKWFPAGGPDSEVGWICRLSKNVERLKHLMAVARQAEPNVLDLFQNSPSDEPHVEFIKSVVTGKPARLVLNVPNGETIPSLPPDVFVEVSCLVHGEKIQPESIKPLPSRLMLYVIIPRWLRMERVIEAFLKGDKAGLVLDLAEDHRTKTFEQALNTIDQLLELPWNEDAKSHYKDVGEGLKFVRSMMSRGSDRVK